AMFVYGADFFLFKPGILLLLVGSLLTFPLSLGPITLGPVTLSLHWMLLGLALSVLGLQSVFLGGLSQVLSDFSGRKLPLWNAVFSYNRAVLISVILFCVGLGLDLSFFAEYAREGFKLASGLPPASYRAVTGILLIIGGFQYFSFTLMHHLILKRLK
ncbi:MAG TPA: glycosyltransferase family 2 protein, partial [Bdellovibrionota bacterium]|nr:glycosyltransferase family 2 protein [Bdellovibrionota bacterium]